MRLLSASLLAASLLAAAEPAPPLLAELQIADGAQLMSRWAATPLGRTWQDPALEHLRTQFATWEATVATDTGHTPSAWLAALRDVRAEARSRPDTIPFLTASADLGPLAEAGWTTLIPRLGTTAPAQVPGADAGLTAESITWARFGSRIAVAGPRAVPAPITTPMPSVDVVGALHLTAILTWLDSIQGRPELEQHALAPALHSMMSGWKDQHLTHAEYRLTLVPEGVLEVLRIAGDATPGCLPVDQTVTARLSATTTAALAMGFDLAQVWTSQRTALLTQWAPLVGKPTDDLDAVEAAINQFVVGQGIDVRLAEVMATSGTLVFALSPGSPVPGFTCWFPRSPAIDRLMTIGAAKASLTLPAEGTGSPVFIPGMPLPLMVARTATHWSVTTDPVQHQAFLGGAGGWTTGPAWTLAMAKAPPQAHLIGACDTPALLRQIQGLAGMALGMSGAKDPQLNQTIMAALMRLQNEAATGYIVAGERDGQQIAECRSLAGVMSLPIAAGIAVPAMQASQKKAREERQKQRQKRQNAPAPEDAQSF